MPYINVKTNVKIKDKEALKARLGQLIAIIPSKSESRLMVQLEDGCDLYFAGGSEPCAIAETKVNASTDYSKNEEYSHALIEALSEELGIEITRIYATMDRKDAWYSVKR